MMIIHKPQLTTTANLSLSALCVSLSALSVFVYMCTRTVELLWRCKLYGIWYLGLVELLICRMQELHDVGAQVPIGEFLKGEFTD